MRTAQRILICLLLTAVSTHAYGTLSFSAACRRAVSVLSGRAPGESPAMAELHPQLVLGKFDAGLYVHTHYRVDRPYLDDKLPQLKKKWGIDAGNRVAKSDLSGREKVLAYERLANEISNRVQQVEDEINEIHPYGRVRVVGWEARRFDVGNGIVVFAGGSGQILEFHPDGTVYFDFLNTNQGDPLKKSTLPAYSNDGTLKPDTTLAGQRRKISN